MLKHRLRHSLRSIALRFPALQRAGGRLGLGRLLAPSSVREQVRVDGDIVIELDMSVPMFRYLYFYHDLSAAAETQLFRAMLRADDVVVDVGAHIGVFALVAAKYATHVHAFEISPSTAVHLQRNLALNPELAAKITVHPVGLDAQPGQMELYNSRSNPDMASLRPHERKDAFSETVQVTTLDLALAGVRVDWLKIDVEGAELGVLRGASEHIAASRPYVFLELFEEFQQRFGAACADIDRFFAERNYTGYLVQTAPDGASGVQLARLDLARLDRRQVNNALYAPAERVQQLPVHLLERMV
jgi:FkbM family methyltransferase